MNNKGFMFVETIITTTILIVALVVIYVSYSVFIVSEKRRLYYDDMSYVYKTLTIRDVMYTEDVSYYTSGVSYHNVNALKKWAEAYGNGKYYIISNEQTMFKYDTATSSYASSSKFRNIMNKYHSEYLVYIPNLSNLKNNSNDVYDIIRTITDINISEVNKDKAAKLSSFGKYIERLEIPCEYDKSLCIDSNGNSIYNGIIISIVNEFKNGEAIDEDYINYMQCMENNEKDTMQCQEANYLTWVYA